VEDLFMQGKLSERITKISMKKLKNFLLFTFLTLSFMVKGADFRFALITDIHISQGTAAVEDLQNSVNQINQNKNVDFVLVTGDITEYGDKKSLSIAKSILDQLTIPYYTISGNHETTWSKSGCTAFAEVFGSEYFKFKHKGYVFMGFPSGPVLRMSDSHISPKTLDWLTENLKEIGTEQPVFLMNHYPMREGDVDNWYEVLDVVHSYRICAFLGGHYHRNLVFNYEGIPGLLNRSNLRAKEAKGGYTLYEIKDKKLYASEVGIGKSPVKWAELALGKHPSVIDWSKRPSYAINKKYPKVSEVWCARFKDASYAAPIVYDKKIYAGDDAGEMHAYHLETGDEIWTFKTGARVMGKPAAAENRLIFGSCDHFIYACNAQTGELLWKIKANDVVMGGVTIHDGVAYVGASDGIFRAIDIVKGKVKWTYNKIKGYVQTSSLVYNDKVYFGAWDATFYALNLKDGSEAWQWHEPIKNKHYSPAACWPVAANGAIFIVDPERAMTAIDAKTGVTNWRTKQSKVRESMGLSIDKKRIYAKTMNDSVVCYSTNVKQPQHLWSIDVGFGYEHAPAMLQEKDNVLYGTTKSGLVFAIDVPTQQILWKHKVGNSLLNTVFPISKTECIVSGSEGKLVLLRYQP
jgi:outer membrane protein assembly factor BamB/Icc-related predicted phosphoesterase